VDIVFNSATLNEEAATLDGGTQIPCLVLQYDPPWDETSVGDHYHYMPLDAIADAQIIFGLGSDMESVEFHILNHAADVEMNKAASKGQRAARDRQGEKMMMIRGLIDQVGHALLAEVNAVEVTDEKTMREHIFKISTEVGEGNIKMARAAAVASPMALARSKTLSSLMGDAKSNSIDKKAPGYSALTSILADNADRIEESRRKVLDMKYGQQVRMAVAQRVLRAKMEKEKGK
jgi:hypothetical protein